MFSWQKLLRWCETFHIDRDNKKSKLNLIDAKTAVKPQRNNLSEPMCVLNKLRVFFLIIGTDEKKQKGLYEQKKSEKKTNKKIYWY